MPSLKMILMRMDVRFDEDKTMRISLERDLTIPLKEELLDPKEELLEREGLYLALMKNLRKNFLGTWIM